MNKILIAITSLILLAGCSVANPKVSFGKKCVDKGDQVHYSYVWIYDKNAGLLANEKTCDMISD
jgi:hypothetical protein|tara:strand:- start:2047 stop:2238 length:192 start_codon:yes stop_codon:yes gene_type:complete